MIFDLHKDNTDVTYAFCALHFTEFLLMQKIELFYL